MKRLSHSLNVLKCLTAFHISALFWDSYFISMFISLFYYYPQYEIYYFNILSYKMEVVETLICLFTPCTRFCAEWKYITGLWGGWWNTRYFHWIPLFNSTQNTSDSSLETWNSLMRLNFLIKAVSFHKNE